jgi:DNA-binding transcriptional MerR regulator
MTQGFTETTGSLAREAKADTGTVRSYADQKLIECIRLPNGVRLFKPSAVEQVRVLLAQRLARRGRHGMSTAG